VTASKFPFPTVCADKQSTDWFHAIGRTLKWNERERQKSFVVVEEGPAKKSKKKAIVEGSPSGAKEPIEGQAVEDHEEDEAEEDEEDDKFDIDDFTVDAQSTKGSVDSSDSALPTPAPNPQPTNDIIRLPSSGIGTPDRFASSRPQPAPLTQRHLIHDAAQKVHHDSSRHHAPHAHRRLQPTPVSTSGSQQSPEQQLEMQMREEDGERDFIRAPESLIQSNRSKIPKDRDVESDSMRTPKAEVQSGMHTASPNISRFVSHHHRFHPTHPHHPHRNHRRHTSVDGYPVRRAFAAWGRDESDSNASDSDA
jgi:NAD+ kinase